MHATEECAIELASMVRCNSRGDMGFVNNANRLNVLISRAKHGMIIFGDLRFLTTAARSESGKKLWRRFETLLQAGGHVYTNGLPIVCERHPAVCSDVSSPSQFGELAPNGSCTQVSVTAIVISVLVLLQRLLIVPFCERDQSCTYYSVVPLLATLGAAATYALHCHSCYNSSSHQQQAVVSYLYASNKLTNISFSSCTYVLILV
jgi:AAA domain